MRTASSWIRGASMVILLACLLGACASTDLVNQWKSPEYSGGPIRKVLVVGVAKQPSVRRVFEDEFASKLKAVGVEAIPSYTVIKEDGQAERALLESTVKELGVDGVMVTRLVRREKETAWTPGHYGPPGAPVGVYGYYSSAWAGYYEPPTAYQYDVVTLETSLYSPTQSKLVWSGITQTFAPQDVRKETAGFSDIVIGALRKQRII